MEISSDQFPAEACREEEVKVAVGTPLLLYRKALFDARYGETKMPRLEIRIRRALKVSGTVIVVKEPQRVSAGLMQNIPSYVSVFGGHVDASLDGVIGAVSSNANRSVR